jgi:hypothetical protein
MQSQLVSIQSAMSTNIDAGLEQLKTTAQKVVSPYLTGKNTYKGQVTNGDTVRVLFMLIVLIMPVTSLLAVAAGGVTKSGCPFTAYYWIGYVGSFFVFVMFAIHLPLAVVLSDGCTYVSTVDKNFSAVPSLAEGTPPSVRNALFCTAA